MQCPRPRTRRQAPRPRAPGAAATSPRPPQCSGSAPGAPRPAQPCPARPAPPPRSYARCGPGDLAALPGLTSAENREKRTASRVRVRPPPRLRLALGSAPWLPRTPAACSSPRPLPPSTLTPLLAPAAKLGAACSAAAQQCAAPLV